MSHPGVDALLAFAAHPQPRFIDFAAEGGKITALRNVLEPPASNAELDWLRTALQGTAQPLLDFYARSNGMRLFGDSEDEDTCFFFLPIGMMDAERAGVQQWIEMGLDGDELVPDEASDLADPSEIYGVPSFWDGAVVFAGFGYAPERLFVAVQGPFRGQVFCHEHDGGYTHRVAMDIDDLLHQLTTDSAGFMRKQYGVGYYDVERYEAG